MNGKKELITRAGETPKYTRRLYPGDIYIWERPQKKPTNESQQQ